MDDNSYLFWFVSWYFLFFPILPRKSRRRNIRNDRRIEKGDWVVTIGGIREKCRVKEESIMLKVAENMEIEMVKKLWLQG